MHLKNDSRNPLGAVIFDLAAILTPRVIVAILVKSCEAGTSKTHCAWVLGKKIVM